MSTSDFIILMRYCLYFSSSGSVDLTYSKVLYQDLTKGLDGLLLNSYLHLVYLVTPYDMLSQCKPDWMTYLRQVQACLMPESPFTCSKMCVKQLLLTHFCSSRCCHLQNRGCPQPSECLRVLLSDKLPGR